MAVGLSAQTAAKPIQPSGPAKVANTQQTYAALRRDLPASEGVAVKGLTLEREGGTFHFDQGTFYFYAPVDGRVTGAVFVGTGRFVLAVTDERNRHSLSQLASSGGLETAFSTVVLRFTDQTAEEIQKASAGAAGVPSGEVIQAAQGLATTFRKTLNENLDLRLLADVLGSGRNQFFLASFKMGGTAAGRNVLFIVDPDGTFHAAPDEVELSTWNDASIQTWVAYRMETAAAEDRGRGIQVTDEDLDVTLDSTGKMTASAVTTVKARRDGARVLRLNLYPTLRVSGVYGENGAPLNFVQEASDSDPDFAVILPQAMKAGQTTRVLTVYSGGGALLADGNRTYHLSPDARDSWYPSGQGWMGDLANFQMTFHLPKDLQIVATGKQVELTPEGNGRMKSVWQTSAPISAAGFDMGVFKTAQLKTLFGYTVDAYADVNLPDKYMPLQKSGTMGNMSTVPALKDELKQGAAAFQIYTDYFGKLPYDRISLTQQSYCGRGASWPMLVSLPICGFWRAGIQHQLGLLDYDTSYWNQVTLHEVAHQWWGNRVGFNSYRDQWMSIGFSNFSVGEYLRSESKNTDSFRAFWKQQLSELLQKDPQGRRPIDSGSLTMGTRLLHAKDQDRLRQELLYGKGAMVLHMLDMLYWTPEDGETTFKHAIQEFVSQYGGKVATTEDFKASMEKTMPKWMNIEGNGRLDWFFDDYVYGTDLPHYTISSTFTVDNKGITSAHMKLTQSHVSKGFVALLPVYLEVEGGETHRFVDVVIHGNATIDQTIKLGKLPKPAEAMLLNYNSDILCDTP